jgi:hypothetical protein
VNREPWQPVTLPPCRRGRSAAICCNVTITGEPCCLAFEIWVYFETREEKESAYMSGTRV